MNKEAKNKASPKLPASKDERSRTATGSNGRSTLIIPLIVLLTSALLSFLYYEQLIGAAPPGERIVIVESREGATSKSDASLPDATKQPEHNTEKHAVPTNNVKVHEDEAKEPAQEQEVPRLINPDQVAEGEEALLAEEYSQRCQIGRGGVPKSINSKGKIDVIDGKPEMEFFYDKYVRPGKPVVIKNAMKSWKAIGSWTDAYLIEKIGDKLMKVRGPTIRSLADEKTKWSFSNMTFTNFTQVYFVPKPVERNAVWEHYYLDSEFPTELKADVDMPDWIPCLYDEPPPFFRYTNMWMGGGEEISLLHNDWEDNLLHVVSDPKTPSEYLYEVYDDKVTETKLSPVNPTDPDVLSKYPLFANAEPIQVLLEPGDIIFIPALYWHQVNSYCRHISVNIWWDTHFLRDITEYVYSHKTADCVKRLHRRLPVCKWKRRKDNKAH